MASGGASWGGKGSGDGCAGNPTSTEEATMHAQLRVLGRSSLLKGVLGGMSQAKGSDSVAEHLKMLRDAVRVLRSLFFKLPRRGRIPILADCGRSSYPV